MMHVEIIKKTDVLEREIESHEMYLKQVQRNASVEIYLSRLRAKHQLVMNCTNINQYLHTRYNELYKRFVEVSELLVNSQWVTTFVSQEDMQKEVTELLGRLDEVSTLILMMDNNH